MKTMEWKARLLFRAKEISIKDDVLFLSHILPREQMQISVFVSARKVIVLTLVSIGAKLSAMAAPIEAPMIPNLLLPTFLWSARKSTAS